MTKSLVVAIEPDRHQATRLSGIVRSRLGAELVLAESAARALATLGDRIPDLILTPALLSARDEAALAGRLRELGAAAAHVQTLTVPRIGGASVDRSSAGGMFDRFRRSRPAPAESDGCEPEVFAQQVSAYLQRAQAERAATIPAGVESPEDEPLTGFDQAFMSVLERAPVPVPEPAVVAVVDDEFEEAPLEAIAASTPVFGAIEPEPPAATVEPETSPNPVLVVSEPVEAVTQIPDIAAAPPDAATVPLPIVEAFVAPLAIIDEAVGAPLVEAFVTSPELAEAFIAPPLNVEELLDARPVVFEAPPPVEALIDPEPFVEEFSVPVRVVDELIEPAPIAVETFSQDIVAGQPAAAAKDPSFDIDDIDLEFWIGDEPEPVVVEAAPVEKASEPAQPADDRVDIASQDADDIDMSAILDGLALEPAEPAAPEAVELPVAAASDPEPAPQPAPWGASRRTPRRQVAVHALPPPHKPARRRSTGPVQDEWGLFDPQQCGFAALVAKLDAVTEDEEVGKAQGTSARLLSYN